MEPQEFGSPIDRAKGKLGMHIGLLLAITECTEGRTMCRVLLFSYFLGRDESYRSCVG